MKLQKRLAFGGVVFLMCLVIWLTSFISYDEPRGNVGLSRNKFIRTHQETIAQHFEPKSRVGKEVVLSIVACGDRVQETLILIKSALIFSSSSSLKIIVIADENIIQDFDEKLTEWRMILNGSFSFETKLTQFPEEHGKEWRKLFKLCASQRLFLPSLLSSTDSVLYVDTDVLFLSPPEAVWDHFKSFNDSQLAALVQEHEDPNIGWYNRFARHPFYGKLGVNSGVMLMNLTRMRAFKWERYLLPILKQYKLKMTWGDQDIINIIFHYHPERLLIMDCSYNYRSDHCMYKSVCPVAESDGIKILHGSRGSFHKEKQPALKAIYQAFQEYQVGSDVNQYLLAPMEYYLKAASQSNCGKLSDAFLQQIRKFLNVPY